MPDPLEPATVIVMTRAPAATAKTRLADRLSPSQREALVQAMLEDELETIARAPDLAPLLACHPSPDHPVLQTLARRYGAELLAQGEGELGDRLARAITAALARGFRRILVVGSDSPTLPLELLEQARVALETADVVLGPAFDGGYYLIGVKALAPALFESIPWSTSHVLAHTVRQARLAGLEVALLPFWYDVDTPEDLDRLTAHLGVLAATGAPGGRRTAELLAHHFSPPGAI